ALEHGVHLFLPVLRMIVLWILIGVRRHVDHLDPERLHPEPVANQLERPSVRGVEVVELLDGDVSHLSLQSVSASTLPNPITRREQPLRRVFALAPTMAFTRGRSSAWLE